MTKAHSRAAIINTFTDLGMPHSVQVGQIASAARSSAGKREILPVRNLVKQLLLEIEDPILPAPKSFSINARYRIES